MPCGFNIGLVAPWASCSTVLSMVFDGLPAIFSPRFNASRGKKSRMGNTLAIDDAWKDYLTVRQRDIVHDHAPSRDIEEYLNMQRIIIT